MTQGRRPVGRKQRILLYSSETKANLRKCILSNLDWSTCCIDSEFRPRVHKLHLPFCAIQSGTRSVYTDRSRCSKHSDPIPMASGSRPSSGRLNPTSEKRQYLCAPIPGGTFNLPRMKMQWVIWWTDKITVARGGFLSDSILTILLRWDGSTGFPIQAHQSLGVTSYGRPYTASDMA